MRVEMQWNIYLITNAFPIKMTLRSVRQTGSEIFIPAGILNHGIYRFEFTVQKLATRCYSSYSYSHCYSYVAASATNYTFIEITDSNITANLVKYGTSIITVSLNKDLILNPGLYTIDPDRSVFDGSVSSFFFLIFFSK